MDLLLTSRRCGTAPSSRRGSAPRQPGKLYQGERRFPASPDAGVPPSVPALPAPRRGPPFPLEGQPSRRRLAPLRWPSATALALGRDGTQEGAAARRRRSARRSPDSARREPGSYSPRRPAPPERRTATHVGGPHPTSAVHRSSKTGPRQARPVPRASPPGRRPVLTIEGQPSRRGLAPPRWPSATRLALGTGGRQEGATRRDRGTHRPTIEGQPSRRGLAPLCWPSATRLVLGAGGTQEPGNTGAREPRNGPPACRNPGAQQPRERRRPPATAGGLR